MLRIGIKVKLSHSFPTPETTGTTGTSEGLWDRLGRRKELNFADK